MPRVRYEYEQGAPVPDLTALRDVRAGEPATYELVARYLDTEDLRLAARGITLREDAAGWHLDLPGEPAQRLRASPADDLPVALVAHLRDRPLVHVATLATRRTVTPLVGADDEVIGEITDDEVTAEADGRTERWREIELTAELPLAAELPAAEALLRESGARPARPGLGRLAPPKNPPARDFRTAGDVITSYVTEQTGTLLSYDPRVRRAEYDAVHKMRVSVGRIRSILRTAAPLFDREPVRWLEAELKWLADELGEVRDLEVLRERFTERLAELGEPAPAWLDGLGDRERRAYEGLRHTLAGERYFAILDALDAFTADPPLTGRARREAGTAMPALVAGAWRRVLRRHAELEHADDPDEARHRTRKAAKRARYTAEAARPLLGDPARRLAAQASRVQETLGAYQDSVIAREHLAELRPTETEAPTIGRLIVVERDAADQALNDAHEVWREATDPKYVEALTSGQGRARDGGVRR